MEGAPRTSKALSERASGTIGNKLEKQPLQETRSPLRAKFENVILITQMSQVLA